MGPLVVVEAEVAGQALPRFARRARGLQGHLLILDGAPEALGEDVVQGPTFAVHADLDAALLQAAQVLRAGEVAAPVAVPDRGAAHRERRIDGLEHEAQLRAL